jgi:phosphoglucomutase/phosphomannomutase
MGDVAARLEEGIRQVSLPDELKAAAIAHARVWLEDARFAEYRPALVKAVERGDFKLLADSFYRMLPFGTGGRRGAMGVGPNRMNPYTVTTSVQGHCEFLKKRFPGAQLTVVVAADVRRFLDVKGLYDRESLGSLYGLSSRDLSVMAACVYAANGVVVYMADPNEETFVSTPELSFLIYHLKAHGGLNMSASHNPPDDNGAKFYNAAGGQEVPPYDEELVTIASGVDQARTMPFAEACKAGLVRFLTPGLRSNYIRLNLGLSQTGSRSARVAFSPLSGTGLTTAYPVLKEAGFPLFLTESQAQFDGSFVNVPFRIPNPEVHSAMDAVIATAIANQCDVAMATDPDADRLGVAVPGRDGAWRCLTGNQIGLLVAYHLLSSKQKAGTLKPSSYVVKTEVTTGLLTRMAESFGARSIGHLLVGFKYIGDVLDSVARTGRWRAFTASEPDFVMAMEESHGYLATPLIRDKDAANGALLIAELASVCKDRGMLLAEALMGLYKQFGYFGTALKSVVMEGAAGLASIRKLQDSLRADPPTEIGGLKVHAFHDRQDAAGVFGPIVSQTDAASRDVLVFELQGNVRLTLRPSGTEPKNKSYAEMAAQPLGASASDQALAEQVKEVNQKLAGLLNRWEIEMMRRVGVTYPDYATALSDSISLDRKLLFVNELESVVHGLCAASGTSPKSLADQLAPVLARVGPVKHVRAGVEAASARWEPGARERLLVALAMLEAQKG